MAVSDTAVAQKHLDGLRNLALEALSRCKSIRSAVAESGDTELADAMPQMLSSLVPAFEFLELYDSTLDLFEQALAIENFPAFAIGGESVYSATSWTTFLTVRYREILEATGDDLPAMRQVFEAMPPIDLAAANKRVLDEWAAAVRLMNGASLPPQMVSPPPQPSGPPNTGAASAVVHPPGKQRTPRGEGAEKIVGALLLHHKYKDGGCGNMDPIGGNELAKLAGVGAGTVTSFWKKWLKAGGEPGNYDDYVRTCRTSRIPFHLAAWTGDASSPDAIQALENDIRRRMADELEE